MDSATARVKPWVVIDTQAGQKGHSGSLPGMIGPMQTAYVPIVWQLVVAIVEKKEVGNWPGLVLVVGAQSVERKPVVWRGQDQFVLGDFAVECSGEPMVGQLVGQVVSGIVVGMGPSVEWWPVVREPFVGQW